MNDYQHYWAQVVQHAQQCLACMFELDDIGPPNGPTRPASGVSGMTPREWAGGGPLKRYGT